MGIRAHGLERMWRRWRWGYEPTSDALAPPTDLYPNDCNRQCPSREFRNGNADCDPSPRAPRAALRQDHELPDCGCAERRLHGECKRYLHPDASELNEPHSGRLHRQSFRRGLLGCRVHHACGRLPGVSAIRLYDHNTASAASGLCPFPHLADRDLHRGDAAGLHRDAHPHTDLHGGAVCASIAWESRAVADLDHRERRWHLHRDVEATNDSRPWPPDRNFGVESLL